MCGIAGYRAFGEERPTGAELTNLLVESQDRGRDATGVAYTRGNALQILKNGVDADEFVKSEEWKEVINQPLPEIMILHCRQGTGGSANDNRNNHPIFNKKGMALIHNGIISNHKDLANKHKLKLDGEVDSEIILKLIEPEWWGSIKNLNELAGGFACAAIFAEQPKELMLFRHTNPIVCYMDKERDILFWASTKSILKASLVRYHRGFPCSDISTFEVSDDSAMLIDEHGVKDLVDIKPRSAYCSTYSWDQNTNSWKEKGVSCGSRQGNFRGEKKKEKSGKAQAEQTTGKEQESLIGLVAGEMGTCDECNFRTQFLKKVGDKQYCRPCLVAFSQDHKLYCKKCNNTIFAGGVNMEKVWCPHCQTFFPYDEVRVWSGRYFGTQGQHMDFSC